VSRVFVLEVLAVGVLVGDLMAELGRHRIPQRELAAALGLDAAQVSSVLKHAASVPEEWLTAVRRIAERRLEPVAEPAEGAAA